MSWVLIAKKDFKDAIRAKTIWALTALFVLMSAGIAYFFTGVQSARPRELATMDLLIYLMAPAAIVIPIASVVTGYKAIVGERESGSLKMLMVLPHSRRDVLLGKFVGRAGVVTVSISVAFIVASVVIAFRYAEFSILRYGAFVLVSILFGLAYVSIAVALSTTSKSSKRVSVGVIGVFLLFQFVWGSVPNLAYYLAYGSYTIPPDRPDWIAFLGMVNPDGAFARTVAGLLPSSSPIGGQIGLASPPVYLTTWAGVVILIAWTVLPIVVSYFHFRTAPIDS